MGLAHCTCSTETKCIQENKQHLVRAHWSQANVLLQLILQQKVPRQDMHCCMRFPPLTRLACSSHHSCRVYCTYQHPHLDLSSVRFTRHFIITCLRTHLHTAASWSDMCTETYPYMKSTSPFSQQSGIGNIVQNTGIQAELVRSPNEMVHPTKLTYQFTPFGEGSTVQTSSRDQGGHKRNVFDVDSDDKEHDTSLRAKLRRKRDNEESALASEHDTTPDRQEMPPASSMDQHFRRTNMLMSLSLPSTINGVTSQTQSVLGTSSNTSHRRTHGHHVMFRSQNSIQTRNFEKMCARGDLCLGAEGHQELTIDHNDHRQYCYYAKTQKGARGPSRARTP